MSERDKLVKAVDEAYMKILEAEREYDAYLDRTHDEAYEAYYGSDDYCEECESEECECDYEEDSLTSLERQKLMAWFSLVVMYASEGLTGDE